MKNRIMGSIGVLLFLMIFLLLPVEARADKVINRGDSDNLNMKKGVVVYVTKDTTASTETTWRTEGFTLKNTWVNRTNPNTSLEDIDPTQNPKGTILFEDLGPECKESRERPDGYTITTFKIPSDAIETTYKAAKVDKTSLRENGGNIYLNGIFRVYNYGVLDSPTYYKTLYKIKHAKTWRNPNDFLDHFNIEIPFEPVSYPVYVKQMNYIDGKYKTFDYKLIGEYPAESDYATTTSQIAAKLYEDSEVASPDENLYLYGSCWSALKDEKIERQSGTYRKQRDLRKIDNSINPLKDWDSYRLALRKEGNQIRDREFTVVEGGIEIIFLYKQYKVQIPDSGEGTEEITGDIIQPYTTETIQADNRFNESFDSTKGIPTTESQYVCAYTDDYLVQYKFVRYYGYNSFKVVSGSTVSYVTRNYSYWKIEDLNVYAISYARASNYSLPGGVAYLTPTSYYSVPQVSYQIYSSNYTAPAEGGSSVGQYAVWNDALTFNGAVIMDSTRSSAATPTPKKIPASGRSNAYALYQSGYRIDAAKANGEYESEGVIGYTRTVHLGDDAEGTSITYDVDEINDVTIHTPVICDAKIEDVRKYNQLINPNQMMASLVLDTFFHVTIPVYGYHSGLKGYGTRDYDKYTTLREAKFPFEVMKNGICVAEGTWTAVANDTQFYLPVWVKEGQYTVEFRSSSINCAANQGINKTEDLANTDVQNYVATDTVDVEVSGRMYNLNIYDITDYPIWQDVFRNKNSLQFTGNNYTVGVKDRNGKPVPDWSGTAARTINYTLPIMNGSHPRFAAIGAIKTGYYTRFSVDTIGNYDGENDYVRITPRFYVVNDKGKDRQEVDLYYTQRFESTDNRHVLVKVGSVLDQKNVHRLNRMDPYLTGNGKLRGVPSTLQVQKNVYTFGNIMIPDVLMSFTGSHPYFMPQVATTDQARLLGQEKSVQTWICEYYLPSTLYICPKDYDIAGYAKEQGALDFSEDFWLKEGFIIVNFELETIQDGERHLSYINATNEAKGFCNMWKLEGGAMEKKDLYGNIFSFNDGDYALYYVSAGKSVKKDYKARGIY